MTTNMSNTPSHPLRITHDRGTLVLTGGPPEFEYTELPHVLYDPRTSTHRAQGRHYRPIIEHLVKHKLSYSDEARGWENKELGLQLQVKLTPHWYQQEALDWWWRTGKRGLIVLPTGTGKTFTAALCVQKTNRPTLVVVPTLDLLRQWVGQLKDMFAQDIGAVGGGDYFFKPITVITYDSAHIHLERWANKFGLLVYDEVHHLPGPSYAETAIGSLAPFRIGLTATPERADGGEAMYEQLVGPIVYRREITELSGDYLAEYHAKRVLIDLTPDEEETYRNCREIYRQFVQDRGISFSTPNGWQRFIFEASRSAEGWHAMKAYRTQKEIERSASGKFGMVEKLLAEHAGERAIIFTADNATVYKIARRYLIPAITHQTKVKERKQILERFHSGEYTSVVTAQVLNEGVDVPAASVGIVLSGTGSTRENVQRLGRILRKYEGKQAVLYELVARGTAEEFQSERRRQHGAFQ
jgi:superfamily II DNA or RNA helicase